MWRAVAMLAVAVTSSGCVRWLAGEPAPRGVEAYRRVRAWDAVTRLAPGTHVLVAADAAGVLDGVVLAADDTGLSLAAGGGLTVVRRDEVESIHRVGTLAGVDARRGLTVGIGIGLAIVAATRGRWWGPALWDPPLLAGLGAFIGALNHGDVLVYER